MTLAAAGISRENDNRPLTGKTECVSFQAIQFVKWRIMRHAKKSFTKDAAMFEIMAVTKALADETRVRLLAALQDGELCVCQLIELIGLAPSTVSKHLSILRSARLIEGRKNGRWMYYRLAGEQSPPAARTALAWLLETLKDSPLILEDRQRLAQMMKTQSEGLCCK
jgi:DNA-binding transcriptional ArsR family regulator